ncbi:tyrosine-type recombinase/integrase [Candidatus Uhrbacteria bacterium]|nr:tyrosine-type recombinase/integrase [Candidatus Uhrbacteria bacterium]
MKETALPHLDDFLLNIQTNNYSAETLYNYERDLKVFEIFLRDDAKIDFDNTTKNVIEQYKGFLVSRDRKTSSGEVAVKNLSAGSVNRNLSSLRRYLKYLIEMDYNVPVAPDVIRLIKTPKKHARVAEFDQLVKLIETPTIFEKNKIVAIRNRTMLEVLFATGMRISELISIDRNQIDKTGKIFVRGKGKKERFVYLTERAMHWINKYLASRHDNHPALFIPYRGLNFRAKNARVSHNYLQMKIKQYREYLGINVPTSAHSLRHGFATYLAESGANPAAIQILLGHESLETTTRYVHASDRYAEKTHRQFHPLRKKKD